MNLWLLSMYVRCFINDKVCPSNIAEAGRTECGTGNVRSTCLAAGCIWCETTTPGNLLISNQQKQHMAHV